MMSVRTNVAQYNKNIADELEYEELVEAHIEDEFKQHLLRKKKEGDKLGAVCGVIMIVATIVGLGLLFAPVLSSPDPSNFEPEGQARRGVRRHHDRGDHRRARAFVRAGAQLARSFELRARGHLRHVVLDGVACRRHALRYRGAAHERVRPS